MLEEVSFATTSPAPRKAAIILCSTGILSTPKTLKIRRGKSDSGRTMHPVLQRFWHGYEQNVWFLTPEDYARIPNGEEFAWNELELMNEREHMGGENAFWDEHFPILYAVHSDYDYLAVRLTAEGFGSIVHSFAPFWEEPTVLAPDFTTFLEVFATAAQTVDPSWPYSIFLWPLAR